jgi:transposase InsO family protein
MSMQGKLSIERMCQLTGVSRAGFYRSLQEQEPGEEDVEVRSTIQKIFAEHKRRYGYRRVSAELRRRGMLVNHKRVARLMREDNLLAVQPKAFVVTTDSDHDLEVYLNLASRMNLTGVNQLWVVENRLRQLGTYGDLQKAAKRNATVGAAEGSPGGASQNRIAQARQMTCRRMTLQRRGPMAYAESEPTTDARSERRRDGSQVLGIRATTKRTSIPV